MIQWVLDALAGSARVRTGPGDRAARGYTLAFPRPPYHPARSWLHAG
jgi:hypothetical protein